MNVVARVSALVGSILLVPAALRADYPPPANMSEQMPPTAEDWLRLELRRQARVQCPCCRPAPLILHSQIFYYPCPPARPCGEPVHASFHGVYGSVHPMPYYIRNPHLVVDVPGRARRCPRCGRPNGLPNTYQPSAADPKSRVVPMEPADSARNSG